MDEGVDIVVVAWKSPTDLRGFLNSWLDAQISIPTDLWVVLNEFGSEDIDVASQYPSVHVILNTENEGYARAVNQGVKQGDRPVVGIFNADTRFLPRVVEKCNQALRAHKEWAVLGPRTVDDDGMLTNAGVVGSQAEPQIRFWKERDRGQADDVLTECPTVFGAAYFIKRSVWNELTDCSEFRKVAPDAEGAFLPTPHYYEETYCSYHARHHGYKCVYYGPVHMVHRWHKASPVGGFADSLFEVSRKTFREACDAHSIEHD